MFSILVSLAVFANTTETSVISTKTVETETLTDTVEDGWWDCYLIDTTVTTNPISGQTTQTDTYRCFWVSF